MFIRAENDKKTGLHYGVNFTKDIPLSRDRSGLVDRSEASAEIYQIWEPLLLNSSDARKRYIELLLRHDQKLDVIELPENISPEVATALVVALREEHGEDAFFYWADETTESVRIITSSLKRTPFRLTKLFWRALREHNTIMSPEEAREKAFTKLLPYHPDESGSQAESQTMHTVRAFFKLDPHTDTRFKKWSFKSCHFDLSSVEISVGDTETYLSDLLLKPAYVFHHPAFSFQY